MFRLLIKPLYLSEGDDKNISSNFPLLNVTVTPLLFKQHFGKQQKNVLPESTLNNLYIFSKVVDSLFWIHSLINLTGCEISNLTHELRF